MRSVFILCAICVVGSMEIEKRENFSSTLKPQEEKLKSSTKHQLGSNGRKHLNEGEDFLRTDDKISDKLKDDGGNDSFQNSGMKTLPKKKVQKFDNFDDDFFDLGSSGFLDDGLSNYQIKRSSTKYGGYQNLLTPVDDFFREANQFVESLKSETLQEELESLEYDYFDHDFLIHVYYIEHETAIEILENLLYFVAELFEAQNQKNQGQEYMRKQNNNIKSLADNMSSSEPQAKASSRKSNIKRNQSLKTRTQKLKELDDEIGNLANKASKISQLVSQMEKLTED